MGMYDGFRVGDLSVDLHVHVFFHGGFHIRGQVLSLHGQDHNLELPVTVCKYSCFQGGFMMIGI